MWPYPVLSTQPDKLLDNSTAISDPLCTDDNAPYVPLCVDGRFGISGLVEGLSCLVGWHMRAVRNQPSDVQ